jgi:multicomponent Na+:H+ antiporter subunit E
MSRIRTIVLLSLFYLGLTANLEVTNILTGVLIAIGVSFMIPIPPQRLQLRQLPAAIWALLRYTIILILDLIKSGVQVARILVNPELSIKPGIIAFKMEHKSEINAALDAHAITLAPGELVVEMTPDCVDFTHFLDVTNSTESLHAVRTMRKDMLDKIFPDS